MEEHLNITNKFAQPDEGGDDTQPGKGDASGTTVSDASSTRTPSEASLRQEHGEDIRALLAEMEDLRRDFETKVQYDESKERLIQSLHRELQEYREGLHFRILKPICIDLIALYDDLGKFSEHISQEGSQLSHYLARQLLLYQETIEEILRRNDVDVFISEEPVFLPTRQRVLQVIPVDNLALDRYIARRVRKGFESGNRLLRPEIVEIYKYSPPSGT
jgi:molecular chaperone GrpE